MSNTKPKRWDILTSVSNVINYFWWTKFKYPNAKFDQGTQDKIYDFIVNNQPITISQVAEQMNIDLNITTFYMKRLFHEGQLCPYKDQTYIAEDSNPKDVEEVNKILAKYAPKTEEEKIARLKQVEEIQQSFREYLDQVDWEGLEEKISILEEKLKEPFIIGPIKREIRRINFYMNGLPQYQE